MIAARNVRLGLRWAAILLFFAFVASITVLAQKLSRSAGDDKNSIERGHYLVEEVAKCPECHTPRDPQGSLERDAWLQGAPTWITPVKPIANWAYRAPALAGLPGLTEEQGEQVLEKGLGLQGEPIRPPMHSYHLTHADAQAVIAYLKSLRAKD